MDSRAIGYGGATLAGIGFAAAGVDIVSNATGVKGLVEGGGKGLFKLGEEAVRIQHATGAGEKIISEGIINSQSMFVHGVIADSPGVAALSREGFLNLGAQGASHVVEFSVSKSELKFSEIGDAIILAPLNLIGRNPILIPLK